MNKNSINIPVKKLKIFDNNIRVGRLSSQLNFLRHCPRVEIEYNKSFTIKNFSERKKYLFYKFTGKIKRNINYKKYEVLYTYKYLKYKLKLKNIYLKINYIKNYAYN